MRKKTIILLLLSHFLIFSVNSQIIKDSIYNENIKTVQIYKNGWELSYPVIILNSEDKLKLSFDDFNKDLKNYCYTLIHCNADWEPSDLSFSQFAEGFEQNQITDHLFSSNTLINYLHYSLVLPNENCNPTISGNYIIKVYDDFDDKKIVFMKRFYICENIAAIDLKMLQPEIAKYMKRSQQFKISVKPNVEDYTDLKTEIRTFIFQNNPSAGMKTNIISRLGEDNTLFYDDLDSNLFEGGNEYRNFDIKSTKYQSPRIQKIEFASNSCSIDLYPDELRNRKQYFFDKDLNGNYYIANSLGINKDRDADYLMVKFSLPLKDPFLEGDVYIYGALTGWECNKTSKMVYNFQTHSYYLQLLLKQGYYNYLYAFKEHESNEIDLTYLEGNHFETENDYLVFVYYKQFSSRYERLIGFTMGNSIKKAEEKKPENKLPGLGGE